MKKFLLSLFSLLILSLVFLSPALISSAQSDAIKLENPIQGVDNVPQLIGKIINTVFGVVGALALLMFVYGGLLWMSSGGNSEQVKKGQNVFIWSAVGLAVIFLAYAISNFIITQLTT